MRSEALESPRYALRLLDFMARLSREIGAHPNAPPPVTSTVAASSPAAPWRRRLTLALSH